MLRWHSQAVRHSHATCSDTDIALTSLQDILPPDVPIISVSKGLEVGSGKMMSEVIPSALGRKQPAAFLSGPSFAKEIMDLRPTGVVAASKVAVHLHPMQCIAQRTAGSATGAQHDLARCSGLYTCALI